ncbi:Kiwa anti-phage protein KwaB-like domain-containing protein [Phascolarctobacterium sp.]
MIESISELIEKINSFIVGNESYTHKLTFTMKKKNNYFSFAPNLSLDIAKDLAKHIVTQLEKVSELTPVEFNPIQGCTDQEIECSEITKIERIKDIIISVDETQELDINHANDLSFYCLTIYDEDDNAYRFFRRIAKFKKLSQEGMLFAIQGNTFNKLSSDILGIDGNVDVVIINKKVYIINRIAMERIFSMQSTYEEKAIIAMDIIGKTKKIANFSEFKKDCMGDSRFHKTLTRLLNDDVDIKDALEHTEEIQDVIETFDLNIELTKGASPQLIYKKKDDRMEILRIINDAYCRTCIRVRNVVKM